MSPSRPSDASLVVEFVSDGSAMPAPKRRRVNLRPIVLAIAGLLVLGAVQLNHRVSATAGHGAVRLQTFTSQPDRLGQGYLTSWRYGLPSGQLYGAPSGPDYLQVARGAGRQIQVVTMGSRGCPTLVTFVVVPSANRVVITEDQTGLSGCFLGAGPITNVVDVPQLDLSRPVTVETGRARVVLPVS